MNTPLTAGRPAEILLVDDNEDDVYLTREGFERAKFAVNLHCVENGEHCMAFLRKQAPYADVPSPDLILLDLNMPVMDGRQVLAELVADETLKHLPVIILTTSSDEADILEMYRLRTNSYIVKPVDFEKFLHVVQNLSDYWFALVIRP